MESIVEAVLAHSLSIPDKTAIVYEDKTITYYQLADRIKRYATSLKMHKITKNSRIVMEADDLISFFAAFLACQLYGVTAIPIEKNISIYKLQDILKVTKPKLIFMKNNGESYEDYYEVTKTADFAMPKSAAIASITCTTGTIGKPSLVVHDNLGQVATAENLIHAIGITQDTFLYTNIPFDLAAGYRRVFAALYAGACVITSQDSLSIEALESICRQYPVNLLSLVSADISTLVKDTPIGSAILNISTIESVAGGLPTDIIASFYQKFQNSLLYNVYGSTESGCILYNNTRENHASNCIGLPSVNAYIKLIDENGNAVTKAGKYGYVSVSGDMNMLAYYKKKDLTKMVMKGSSLTLNDIVYFDENGYYYFVSRVGDIINFKGHKIMPSSIEQVACRHESVKDCACVPKNDALYGQVPILFVEPQPDTSFDKEALFAYLRANMENYRVPHDIILIDKIPRTVSGKLMRKSLIIPAL